MEVARIKVAGNRALYLLGTEITSGTVGGRVHFTVDELWNDLTILAVFKAGDVVRDANYTGGTAVIPHEVTAVAGVHLYAGLYGTNAAGTVVIPTVWCDLGMIRSGTAPGGDASLDPALPIWQELRRDVGDLSGLKTVARSSLVAAVNELAARDEGADEAEVEAIVAAYLKANKSEIVDDVLAALPAAEGVGY